MSAPLPQGGQVFSLSNQTSRSLPDHQKSYLLKHVEAARFSKLCGWSGLVSSYLIMVVTLCLLLPQVLSAQQAGAVLNTGNGSDGDLVIQTNQYIVWDAMPYVVSTSLSQPVQTNQLQITVGSTSGFNTNDEVLLYVYRADGATLAAGQYEFFHIVSIAGTNSLTLDHAPTNVYDPSVELVTVRRVPNFQNFTIGAGGTLAAASWSGYSGGLIVFRVQGTLNIAGTINAYGVGFPGGSPGVNGSPGISWQLDGLGSGGTTSSSALLGTDLTFEHLFLGSGGATGNGPNFGTGQAGNGEPGGGLIYATAQNIIMTGSINVTGVGGTGAGYGAEGGGGGSGGEVWLQCYDALAMASTSIIRNGGGGGGADHGPSGPSGGSGFCRLDYYYGPEPYLAETALVPFAGALFSYSGADLIEQVGNLYGSPVILEQPQSVAGNIGSTVMFSVQAGGSQPLNYQWLFDGLPLSDNGQISGSRTNALTINGVQAADAGNFQVVVSNYLGSITSSVATVTGSFPPSIFLQPSGQIITAGTNLTLTVAANGTAPLGYQWQNAFGFLGGQTNSSLVFNPTQTNETGNYSVVISNAYGSMTSAIAQVTINLPTNNSILIPNIGTGLDGNFVVPSGETITWGPATFAPYTSLLMSTVAGQPQIAIGDDTGFSVGDEILIYSYQSYLTNASAGLYQTFHIAARPGKDLFVLDHAPSPIIDITKEIATVQRVPNFNNVTVDGTLAAPAWNGKSGGIIFFRANAALNVSGMITVAGAGFSGGIQGSPYSGYPGVSWPVDALGNAGTSSTGASLGGDPTFQRLFLGSGGGGGNSGAQAGGNGGAGGGIIYAAAGAITVTGSMNASGGGGTSGLYGGEGGGGGSGGTIWLQTYDSSGINCGTINRDGGPANSGDHGPYGNTGGPGLSRVDSIIGLQNCSDVDQTNELASVSAAPVILVEPQSIVAFSGATAVFSVQATGTGSLTYQWLENGTNLVDGGRITGSQSNLLTITGLTSGDVGNYQVVVGNQVPGTNAINSVTSSVATLTVVSQLNPAGASICSFGFSPTLTLCGTLGYSLVIQRTSNLANSNGWVTLTNITLTQSMQLWTDTSVNASSPNNSNYFYRILAGQ